MYSGNSTTTNLEFKKPFSLHILVQNLGQGIAKNVEVNLITYRPMIYKLC